MGSLLSADRSVMFLERCVRVGLGWNSDSALTIVENPEGGGEEEEEAMVTDEDQGDLEVVQPTDQWQTLKPGQAVPAGSHVRLNLQTGQREVRLGEQQLKYWKHKPRQEEEEVQPSYSADELKQALKKMEDLSPVNRDPERQYRPLEELKREMAQLDLRVEMDVQVLRRLLTQLNSTNSTVENRLHILLELEYLVHQVDNAQALCSMGGLNIILAGLNSSDSRLQENSAFVLGSALASNPVVQVEAVDSGALQCLLTLLATTQPLRVKKKVLYAVASLLRHFPYAQGHFLSHGGLQVLSELFRAEGGGALHVRIVTMLYDMISEKELISRAGSDPGPDSSHDELVRQYWSLQVELLEGGWCSLVPQLLQSTEHDWREKALRALVVMLPVCLDRYRSDSSLSDSLGSLRDQYKELVQTERILGEEDSYFGEILNLLHILQLKMK
ncbi:nucleotide exchange factor SIL1 [Diretmus argenteus]